MYCSTHPCFGSTNPILPCHAQGHAVKRGMACARGEVLLFADADGATRVSDLDKLEAELAKVQKQTMVRGQASSLVMGGRGGHGEQ